jgi:hypothetical protein
MCVWGGYKSFELLVFSFIEFIMKTANDVQFKNINFQFPQIFSHRESLPLVSQNKHHKWSFVSNTVSKMVQLPSDILCLLLTCFENYFYGGRLFQIKKKIHDSSENVWEHFSSHQWKRGGLDGRVDPLIKEKKIRCDTVILKSVETRFASRDGMTERVIQQKVYKPLVQDELFLEWLRKDPNPIRQEVHVVVITQ